MYTVKHILSVLFLILSSFDCVNVQSHVVDAELT